MIYLIFFISISILVYCSLFIALYVKQRSFIYYPTPSALPLTAMNTEFVYVSDVQIHLTVRQHHGDKAVLYFGWNGEDVSQNLTAFGSAFPDHAVYLMHYRGYGESGGKPTEATLKADAVAVFDYLQERHPHISVIGRSLGSGIALHVARHCPITALVLVTPYYSVLSLSQTMFPWIPMHYLLEDKFESWRDAPEVTAPTFILKAATDTLVPHAETDRLIACFPPDSLSVHLLPNTDHITISSCPHYLTALAAGIAGERDVSYRYTWQRED